MQQVDTPNAGTIDEVSQLLGIAPQRCLKTLLVEGANEGEVVALVLRGDHQLNAVKAEKLPGVATPLTFASNERIREATGADAGSIGPVGLKLRVVADRAAAAAGDFVCGANSNGKHLTGVNWGRDLPEPEVADLRNVVAGDPSPDGRGTLRITRGIEVGHIFQLGRNYSEAMQCTVLDANGRAQVLTMGCYGIGVSRVVAAAIEQNFDERGIVWPAAIAPFDVALVSLNMDKSPQVAEASQQLYAQLQERGFDVLWDDRDARPGVKFADMELIGIPHRIVISERGLAAGTVEYRSRRASESQNVALNQLWDLLGQP
jgi:prolyl-tRNA synthetase